MKVNRPLVVAAYLTVLLLILTPLIETTIAVVPFRPGAVNWRFGAAGLFSRAVIVPLFGLVLASGLALALGHRRTLRLVSVIVGLASLAVAVASVLFVLDAIQMRSQVPAQAHAGFDRSSLVALGTMWGAALTALLLSIGTWRASSRTAGRGPGTKGDDEPRLIREMPRP